MIAALIAGRTASEMPGLDIAERMSWQNFLDSTLRLYATLNRRLTEAHQLSLFDVRVLEVVAVGENCRRISAALKRCD